MSVRFRKRYAYRLQSAVARPRRSIQESSKSVRIAGPGKSGTTALWYSASVFLPWSNTEKTHTLPKEERYPTKCWAAVTPERVDDWNSWTRTTIVSIREPISGSISALFQNLDSHFEKRPPSTAEILDYLYLNAVPRIHRYMGWLERVFEPHFRLDPHELWPERIGPAAIYQAANERFILLRQEDLFDTLLVNQLQSSLSTAKFRILSSNETAGKAEADMYKAVRAEFRLHRSDFKTIASHHHMQCFYSDKTSEIEAKWCVS